MNDRLNIIAFGVRFDDQPRGIDTFRGRISQEGIELSSFSALSPEAGLVSLAQLLGSGAAYNHQPAPPLSSSRFTFSYTPPYDATFHEGKMGNTLPLDEAQRIIFQDKFIVAYSKAQQENKQSQQFRSISCLI